MIIILGWFNVTLVCFNLIPLLSRRLNRHLFQNHNTALRSLSKVTAKIHPYSGILFLITAFTHGYMALGIITLHTGYIAFMAGLLMLLSAAVGKFYKVRGWIRIHRVLALLLAATVLIHIFARDLF